MEHISARDAKNAFGRLLDAARRKPVAIDRNGRPAAVMLSHEEYQRLQAVEDAYWGALADHAGTEGFAGIKEGRRLLDDLLNA